MNTLVAALLCASIASGLTTKVPEGATIAIRDAGVDVLTSAIENLDGPLESALNEYNTAKTMCEGKLKAAEGPCTSCVQQKCRARADAVCKSSKSKDILGIATAVLPWVLPSLLSKGITGLFVKKPGGGLVNVASNPINTVKDKLAIKSIDLGNKIKSGAITIGSKLTSGITDLGGKIGGIGSKIGSSISSVGSKIGSSLVSVGSKIGSSLGSVGSKVGSSLGSVGSAIGSGLGSLTNVASKVGSSIAGLGSSAVKGAVSGIAAAGKTIAGLLPKIIGKRTSEPDCGRLESDPQGACQVYLDAGFCPDCGVSAEKDCPGYSDAVSKVKVADEARSWALKISDQELTYDILEVNFNPETMEGGKFSGVSVTVQLFGKEFSFTVDQPINPYIPEVAGPIVAQKALNTFKTL